MAFRASRMSSSHSSSEVRQAKSPAAQTKSRPLATIRNCILSLLFLQACHDARTNREPSAPAETRTEVTSNLLRADYAGSDACAGCHADIHSAWSRSPMHRMTRSLSSTEIAAPFDGAVLEFRGDRVVMERRDQAR